MDLQYNEEIEKIRPVEFAHANGELTRGLHVYCTGTASFPGSPRSLGTRLDLVLIIHKSS